MKIGQLIKKRYKVIRLLGAGNMGSVAEVEDIQVGTHFAVKEISQAILATAGSFDAFKKEAAILNSLNHENLVQYRLFETEKGIHYIFTSLVAGQSLEQSIENGHNFSEKDAVTIIIQVLHGLSHAHSKGVVHRDMKPSNIMWNGKTAVVIDFGIARSGGSVGGMTQAIFAGAYTPHFGAPEQIGSSSPDPRNDIYAVGVTMYDMITDGMVYGAIHGGHRRFPQMPADRLVRDSVDSLPGISKGLETILMKATSVALHGRYASADQMIEALETLTLGGTPAVGVPSATPSGKKTTRPKSKWDIRRT